MTDKPITDQQAQRIEALLFAAARRPQLKLGDYLRLSDDTLLLAHRKQRALTPAEREALTDSPLTQARFKMLVRAEQTAGLEQLATAVAQVAPSVYSMAAALAANDADYWTSSALLRAADSGGPLDELLSDDRVWALTVTPATAEHGAFISLRLLDPEAPCAIAVLENKQLVSLRDAEGRKLLEGALNREGVLRGDWALEMPPDEHLRRVGGWSVWVKKQ